MIPTPEQAAQDELAEWIRAKGGKATSRDVARGPREIRGDASKAEAALDTLVRTGRGRWQIGSSGPKGGRPNRIFVLGSGGGGDGTPEIPAGNGSFVAVATIERRRRPPTPRQPRFDQSPIGGGSRSRRRKLKTW